MDERFRERTGVLEPLLMRLKEMTPVKPDSLPAEMPKQGVYVFWERGKALYVGRTDDLRGRVGRHCRPGATHRMAAFAFRLAREATGNTVATYTKTGSRTDLMRNAVFVNAFNRAKARIRAMDLTYVDVGEPVMQALLEMYAAEVLGAPYNDFENH